MQELFGEVIYSYSRAQAINDGVLIDISAMYPITRRLYKFPIACTDSVWNVIQSTGHENLLGIVAKVLVASQQNITTRIDEASHLFAVTLENAAPHEHWTFKIMVHGGDNHEPVITIMQKHED